MLGGFGNLAGGEITKTFENLPKHNKLRITANFHFIDAWQGQYGFMRADVGTDPDELVYIWTEAHDYSKGKNGINICGSELAPENKFSIPIDIILPHSKDTITISFGSKLD